ncbi:FixH family protein [Silvimonas amylolytica]|uniref:FixH family protein n=1 Tax=Silvimonas amylolytica TaxID=449663 RepID=UPI00166AC73B|nr:FixH family protein [Silvimonas amylolytica]
MHDPILSEKKPWYRQPWAWFVLLLPLIAIAGCINLIWLAGKHNDGAVADDYTKTGDEVTRLQARDRTATRLGLTAFAEINARGLVKVVPSQPVAGPLQFRLLHPTVANNDQVVVLSDGGDHVWQGALPHPLGVVRWDIELSDSKGTWRLRGQIKPGQTGSLVLQPSP